MCECISTRNTRTVIIHLTWRARAQTLLMCVYFLSHRALGHPFIFVLSHADMLCLLLCCLNGQSQCVAIEMESDDMASDGNFSDGWDYSVDNN